jgi:subtilisin family serine protease
MLKIRFTLILLALFNLFLIFAVEALNINSNFTHGEIIIKFRSDDMSMINAFMGRIGAYSYERIFPLTNSNKKNDISKIYKLKFSTNVDVASIIQRCLSDPVIEYAQPNYINYPCLEKTKPNDYFYPDQWALEKINSPDAWEIEKGSDDVVVAVVDTGIDYNHEDLISRIWQNSKEIPNNGIDDDGNGYIDDVRGWDFYDSPDIQAEGDHTDRDNDPMDENGHGTIVAGIIGAVPNNSIGIAGVVWDCRIMALRAGNSYFEDDDLCAAIVYAADNGANIINMSWGGDELSYVIRDATKYAYDRGCVLVAAAGNDNQPKVIYPANFEHVIGVGATDNQDKKASFSNYGAGIDIVAPGVRVFGTVPHNHYSDWSGTSMSAPVVSGIVALMLSKRPALNNRDVAQILRASADPIDEPLFSGIGRANANKALLTGLSLTAHINSPNSGESGDNQFVITGTASGKDFKNYQLEYTEVSVPEDWRQIGAPGNNQKWEDVLAIWDISRLSEGSYVVRLKVAGYGDLNAEDRISLQVDHTPPKLLKFSVSPRFSGDRADYVITLKTDDLTRIDLNYRRSQSLIFQKLSLTGLNREHEIPITDYLDSGLYDCFFKMTNSAGLVATDDNQGQYYPLELQLFYTPTEGFLEINTGIPAIYPVSATVDFDGDGKTEVIGMDQPLLDYSTVRIFEKDDFGQYNEVFKSEDDYFPRDVGDSDKDGLLEILGNRKDRTFLLECPSKGSYPTNIIWESDGLWGGQFADTDMDGNIEILSSDINNATIDIYENRGDNSYLRTAKLANPTEGMNHLCITFAVADFDSDGRIEIVGGDMDGDLFIYKNIDNDAYKLAWTGKIPDAYIKSLSSGDFDGDGISEFVVTAEASGSLERASKLLILTIFDWIESDYSQIWSTEITNPLQNIGISAGDLDNDGTDELIAAVTPGLYVFKYSLRPSCLWYHSASPTYHPLIQDIDGDGFKELMFNVEDNFMEFKAIDGKSARQPWGVSAVPSGRNEVEFRWNGLSDTAAYRIHKGTNEGNLRPIATLGLSSNFQGPNWKVFRDSNYIDSGYFRDNDVSTNFEYWYAITSIYSDGRESPYSVKVRAMPNPPPQLLSAIYSDPSALYVYFNEQMGESAKVSDNYSILSGDGRKFIPSSAVLDQGEKRVVLILEPLQNGIYTLNVSEIRDATGVPISDSLIIFYVSSDDSAKYTNLKSVNIYPNPVLKKESRKVTFISLPSGSQITIFNIAGQPINSLRIEESDKGSKIWGLDNAEGYDVSSGIYIYVINFGSEVKIGKIAVLK